MKDDAEIRSVIAHYDALIDENNDPVHDPEELKAYMDTWDGEGFLNQLSLTGKEEVLEIGVGTGRLALRVCPKACRFTGIDLSPKTIARARENLSAHRNVSLILGDFMTYDFGRTFDRIYSSLTFMHISDKRAAMEKAFRLLSPGGLFLLSIDKNPSNVIDMGTRVIRIHPDNPHQTRRMLCETGFHILRETETESAFLFAALHP